jgi:hypothetical protein
MLNVTSKELGQRIKRRFVASTILGDAVSAAAFLDVHQLNIGRIPTVKEAIHYSDRVR